MRQAIAIIGLLALLASPSPAGDLRTADGSYDFFGLARYPEGGKRVEGVELYRVEEGGGEPDRYTRRVVRWWPRKGVDRIEATDGMILREWTRKADLLEAETGPLAEPEIHRHDQIELKDKGPASYVRRIRGYLHPPADGDYVFKISANTAAFFFVSPDEKPENRELVCRVTRYTRHRQWDRYAGQISAPLALKKGRSYYYEVVHRKQAGREGGDHVEAAWQGDQMAEQIVGGENVSALDGERNKVVEERWASRSTGRVRPRDLPRTFRAHLMGFDGIGNPVGDPFKGEDFVAPAVVLRMPDGTKRSIDGQKFCQADREFIMKVYMREMKRVMAGLDKTEYEVSPATLAAYPGEAEIGDPGTMLVESEHFVVPSGSQDDGQGRWINPEQPEKAAGLRKSVMTMFEHFHAYLEYGGHLMPYWDRPQQYKYEVHVGGTIADGHRSVGGGAGGAYGGQGMGFVTSEPGGFGHEYGHGFSLQWNAAHSGEILATASMDITDATLRCDNNVARPYRNCLHSSYNTTLFYRMIGFDPNWGHCAMPAVPKSVGEVSFFQTIARVGRQRGLFEHGIRGVGDTLGDYGARLAEFDTQIQEGLRMKFFAVARNYLAPMDKEQGVYRIPWGEAPEPYGVNIIRLVPEKDAEAIEVDFQGYHDPAVYSDWRACLVAVDRHGKARYSDLWNRGPMVMQRRPGDRRYWLTVTATPRALYSGAHTNQFFQGTHAPRYPWRVTLDGAAPGRPQRTRADLDDVHCAYGAQQPAGTILPAIPDTGAGRRFVKDARAVLADLQKRKAEAQGELEKVNVMEVISRLKRALGAADGAPHPNGGGWVAATAEVAPTAYVGPNAAVLDRAQVLDHAVVEDYAVVRDSAVVADHARVSGQAMIGKGTRLDGYKRAWFPLNQSADDEPPELSAPTDEDGLLANYAMDQAEAVMLESYYRNERGAREFFDPLMNGYLYGRPKFVVDGNRRGFAFDGKTQYAELNQRAADLAEITVDMAVQWQGDGEQTLLDFGSNEDNCFTLVTAGRGDKPEFTALVDGETVAHLTSNTALSKDRWVQVRLEIDGERIALWLDGQEVGETASNFRPCQAFQPGVAKRNFLAAARGGGNRFQGAIDSVVIYTLVHGEDFAELPRPILDAPRRPEPGFAGRARSMMTMSPYERRERIGQLAGSMHEYLGRMSSKATVRLSELLHRTPVWANAIERAKEIDQWKEELRERVNNAFDSSPKAKELQTKIGEIDEQIATVKKKLDAVRKKESASKAEQQPAEPTPRMVELQKQVEQYDGTIAEIKERIQQAEEEAHRAVAAMPETEAEEKEIARLKEEIKRLEPEAKAMLQEAVANDPKKEIWDRARRELKYSPLYWRVKASQGVGGREGIIKDRLKARHPEFRKWMEMKDRVEELERRRRYRYEAYVMKDTNRANLHHRLERLSRKAARLKQELSGAKKRAAGEEGSAEQQALQRRLSVLNNQKGSLRKKLSEYKNVFVGTKMREAGLPEKDKEREQVLSEARAKAMARYYQEDSAIQCMQRSAFHGFYNAPYKSRLGAYCAKLVGDLRVPDNLGGIQDIADAYGSPENWKTSVDQWDWRTGWEKNGSIEELPLTQRWLKRVRSKQP